MALFDTSSTDEGSSTFMFGCEMHIALTYEDRLIMCTHSLSLSLSLSLYSLSLSETHRLRYT